MEKTVKQITSKLKCWDVLYLNIPYVSSKGQEYILDNNFLSTIPQCRRDKIIINRCQDYGPITKLIPTLHKETDPSTLIIVLDDDIRLIQDVSILFLEKHYEYPNCALSLSGYSSGMWPFKYQFTISNKRDLTVDWCQSTHFQLFVRCFVNPDTMLSARPYMKKHDDHAIALYLSDNCIPKISIGVNPNQYLCYDKDIASTGAISGSISFLWENAKIIDQNKHHYCQNHPNRWLYSVTGLIFITVIWVIFIGILNNYMTFKYHDWILMLVFAVILGAFIAAILWNNVM